MQYFGVDPMMEEYLSMARDQAFRLRDNLKTAWLALAKETANQKIAQYKFDTYHTMLRQIGTEIVNLATLDKFIATDIIGIIFESNPYYSGYQGSRYNHFYYERYINSTLKVSIAPFDQGALAVKNWYFDLIALSSN